MKRVKVKVGRARLHPRLWDELQEFWSANEKLHLPTLDFLLACRFLYWCAKKPLIADEVYDTMKEEEMEYGTGTAALSLPASDRPIHYRDHIRSLAFYLLYREEVAKDHPDYNCLPPGWFQDKTGEP
jgi:hypothetical protein